MSSSLNAFLNRRLKQINASQLHRKRRLVTSPQGREVQVDGKKLLNFCSNDYLGLASDPRVLKAFNKGSELYGVGSGASHLVSGHSRAHHQLEQDIARFTGREKALVFSSGYSANMALIRSLVGAGDFVFHDRLNHASLLDGGWLSRASVHWFEHRHYLQLQKQLQFAQSENDIHQTKGNKLIVSDGVFSMDGDCCDVAALVHLAKTNNAWLMIDDAHGFGVLGKNGQGLIDPELYPVDDVPILVGTFGKAFGTAGAFVAGSEDLIEWLVQKARNYIYTTAMPPAIAVATQQSLKIIENETWRREFLHSLIKRFVSGAQQLGLPLLPSDTPIQPLLLNGAKRCVSLSKQLEQRGIFASAIRPPTVPAGSSRIRITISASHTENDIDYLLDNLESVLKKDNSKAEEQKLTIKSDKQG